ncbi:MAG: hypothetical protein ACEY3F_02065 [Wolbachia sp.]
MANVSQLSHTLHKICNSSSGDFNLHITIINHVMDYIVYSVFNFEVCSMCTFGVDLQIFEPCIFYGYASQHGPNITAMMAFVIFGHTIKVSSEIWCLCVK